MKPNLSIFFIVLSLSACRKEKYEIPIFEPGPMTYGWAEAQKENRDWLASAGAYWYGEEPNRFIALAMGTYSEDGFDREDIVFVQLLPEAGIYNITKNPPFVKDKIIGAIYYTSIADGDVGEDNYELDESKYNWINITAVDSLHNKISGSFQVSFKIATTGGKNNPRNPDKVTFGDGAFEVEIFR